MNQLNEIIVNELKQHGIEFVHFVDISGLAERQNRGFSSAVLFGVKCSPGYLKIVNDNPNYVPEMVARNYFDDDEHYMYEMGMYRISDQLAGFIVKSGYKAYSLSDDNQIATNNFNGNKSMLPLKTLAINAGLGWIGKNNLLVNKKYGCAQVWGGILTDAPLNASLINPLAVQCGNCRICLEHCEPDALKGSIWQSDMEREEMIDVDKCTTCLKCMVHCPWTQRYMKKGLTNNSMFVGKGTIDDISELEMLYDELNDYLSANTNYPGWIKGIYPIRETAEKAVEEGSLYILKKGNIIAGSMILNHVPEEVYRGAEWGIDSADDKILVLRTLVVHPRFMKQGIAMQLMDFAKELAISSDIKSIRLDVSVNNTPAIKLYEQAKYKYIGTVDLGLPYEHLKWFKLYELILKETKENNC